MPARCCSTWTKAKLRRMQKPSRPVGGRLRSRKVRIVWKSLKYARNCVLAHMEPLEGELE